MSMQLVEDEFGLFHAKVPHPRTDRNVQVMVLASDGGWWAYVDGERLPDVFASQNKAIRSVHQFISRLPGPMHTLSQPILTPAPRYRRPLKALAVAAYLVLITLTISMVAYAMSDLQDETPLAMGSALSEGTHVFAPRTMTAKSIAVLDDHPAQYLARQAAIAVVVSQPENLSVLDPDAEHIDAFEDEALSAPDDTSGRKAETYSLVDSNNVQTLAVPLPEKNSFKTSPGALIQLVSAVRPDQDALEEIGVKRTLSSPRRLTSRRITRKTSAQRQKLRRTARLAKRQAHRKRVRRGFGYKKRSRAARKRARVRAIFRDVFVKRVR